MSMITATAWVQRGVAAQFPTKYEIDEEEINRISKLAKMQLEEAQDDLKAAQEEAENEDGTKEKKTDDDDAMEDAAEKNEKTEKSRKEYVLCL